MNLEEVRNIIKSIKRKFLNYKIAVLGGGWSSEAKISRRSSFNVFNALKKEGFNVFYVELTPNFIEKLKAMDVDVVFIMLHGKPGEDGTVQGALEVANIPYTGSDVLSSSISMDKIISKQLFIHNNIPTPPYYHLKNKRDFNLEKMRDVLGSPPYIIKPRNEGSSVGVEIIKEESILKDKVFQKLEEFEEVFLEKFIKGKTVTCGVLEYKGKFLALPVLELKVKGREFYDYVAKYTKGLTEFIIPAHLRDVVYREVQKYAIEAHRVIGCKGFSRVDMVVSENNEVFVLEVNSIPGMTELSDLPAEAKTFGLSYEELVIWLLGSAEERIEKFKKLRTQKLFF